MTTGRKPLGPRLVEHLDGSPQAKERLEVILATIAGELTIAAACERLAIGEAMFHRLRTRVLAAGLADLEPRPRGRPRLERSPEQEECEQLTRRVEELERELQIAEVRRELAQTLPHVVNDSSDEEEAEDAALKKTSRHKDLRRRRRELQRKGQQPTRSRRRPK